MSALPGAGAHRFWGFSPALDLLAEAADAHADAETPRRFLLLGPGDARHILRTLGALARRRSAAEQADAPALEFSVYEQAPELLARHLLLFSVALDFELPRRERAELLLELLANSLLREKTSSYLAARAAALRRVITENDGPLAPLIDLSLLKMKDRDRLHDVLCTWAEDVPCDMVRLRDERLRGLYKERYDMRRNVLDWDYTMHLVPLASIVHKLHWREWRQTGIAFELRDSAYVAPNRSLISMAAGREGGRSVMKRGFWGDVASSPFAAVGIECDEARFFKKSSDQHTKNACDVAYYNVLGWLTEIETGKPYVLRDEDLGAFEYGSSVATPMLPKGFLNAGGGKPGTMPPVDEAGEAQPEAAAGAAGSPEEEAGAGAEAGAEPGAAARRLAAAKLAKLPRFRVRLLSGDWAEVVKKPRHQRQYELLSIGSHMAHVLVDPRVNGLLAPLARCLVESAKFIVECHPSRRELFSARALDLAAALGWVKARATAAADLALKMGPAHPAQLRFEYDEATAPTLGAEARRLLKAAGQTDEDEASATAPLELTDASAEAGADTADGEVAVGVEGASGDIAAGQGGKPGAGIAQMLGSLAVGDAEPTAAAAAPPAAAPAAAAPLAPAQPALNTRHGVCVITGLPAKYKDPQTGLPYANLDAYKELRKLHPAPTPPPKEARATGGEAAEGGEGGEGGGEGGEGAAAAEVLGGGVPQRPIILSAGPCGRRINKVA